MKVHFQIDKSANYLLKSEGEAYIRVSLDSFNEFSELFFDIELAERIMKVFERKPEDLLKSRWNSDGTINFLYVWSFPENSILKELGEYHASAYCHQKPSSKLWVSSSHIKRMLDIKEFDDKMLNRIFEIADLSQNWDGYDAIPVKDLTLVSAIKYLRAIFASDDYYHPDYEDVYPTPYGSLVIDFENEDGLVSTEVGRSDFGFFTDFKGKGNYGYEGYTNDFNKMPIPETVKEFITKKEIKR